MDLNKYITQQIIQSIEVKQAVYSDEKLINQIMDVAKASIEALKNGRKIIIAGNGGSAADAQHIACELVSKFYFDRPALSAIALTTNTSVLTAIGNDYGYEHTFARQVQGLGHAGDIFIGISTSGNSENIIKAITTSKEERITTVGLTGSTGGKMSDLCDYLICVPSDETPRIQEAHIMIGHIICSVIEESVFGRGF